MNTDFLGHQKSLHTENGLYQQRLDITKLEMEESDEKNTHRRLFHGLVNFGNIVIFYIRVNTLLYLFLNRLNLPITVVLINWSALSVPSQL